MAEVRTHASQYPSCSREYECDQICFSQKTRLARRYIPCPLGHSWLSNLILIIEGLLQNFMSKAGWRDSSFWRKQPVDVIGPEGLWVLKLSLGMYETLGVTLITCNVHFRTKMDLFFYNALLSDEIHGATIDAVTIVPSKFCLTTN